MPSPFKLLFVCMGNICRSPAAHGVMHRLVEQEGLSEHIHIDSAGTGDWHAGKLPDERMRMHARLRGYNLNHLARQVRGHDFVEFDLFLVMDRENLREIRSFNHDGKLMSKVRLFCDFAEDREETEVPDPYYGGDTGFEHVLDIVENGCKHLLNHIRNQLNA